jgi:hypothetical protein
MTRPTSAQVRFKAHAYRMGYPLWNVPTGTQVPIVVDPYCADWLDLLADLLEGTELHGELMLSNKQVAQLLEVPERMVNAWRLRDTGPVHSKIGGRIRYRLADVQSWLEAQEGSPL